jgi:hypothetical protein
LITTLAVSIPFSISLRPPFSFLWTAIMHICWCDVAGTPLVRSKAREFCSRPPFNSSTTFDEDFPVDGAGH